MPPKIDAPPPVHFDSLGPDLAITTGIDLAAQPKKTAACEVAWSPNGLGVRWHDDNTDARLVELVRRSAQVGLDCPLGWPEPFSLFVHAHTTGQPLPRTERAAGSLDPLQYRLTDDLTCKTLNARGVKSRPPLSASTNLLGVVALRAARLLDSIHGLDRAGTGPVAEVYPAASLRLWNVDIDTESYKKPGATKIRQNILTQLADGLRTPFDRDTVLRCVARHDDLDALVAALAARAVTLGQTRRPETAEEQRLAAIEGWIHLPTQPLGALLAGR